MMSNRPMTAYLLKPKGLNMGKTLALSGVSSEMHSIQGEESQSNFNPQLKNQTSRPVS